MTLLLIFEGQEYVIVKYNLKLEFNREKTDFNVYCYYACTSLVILSVTVMYIYVL